MAHGVEIRRDRAAAAIKATHKTVDFASCALWNLRSKTHGRWFAGKKVGDPRGDVGVVLDSFTPGGDCVFKPGNVSDASVGIALATTATSC
jgi:hypothetical protein